MDYQAWLGRSEILDDTITALPPRALAAMLDRDQVWHPGDVLPPLWHWLYFLPIDRQSALAEDGHLARGGFLPPVDLPRRMWAGSRFRFEAPLRIGDQARRVSSIASITPKLGRTGRLVFVTVNHDISTAAGLAIHEEHDIVYREHAGGGAAEPPPALNDATFSRTVEPTAALLFRYSALTFNGHRIHYDHRYSTEVEHYPGLVVHGPLIATLLLNLFCTHMPLATLTAFEFRSVSPLFDTGPFTINGRPNGELWAANATGGLAMEARATFA